MATLLVCTLAAEADCGAWHGRYSLLVPGGGPQHSDELLALQQREGWAWVTSL